ncbi:hypothetical protein [Caulobacter henricii]|uniref:Uncharacterized protein n=1 Tax=Caulobacter henricii TaxID=69395 RepID=A0A0N7JH14_9CAUL|nr:hypothetical protein [Caulobacter henricii]ALL12122.1 hypothetical protein AQ619_01410 [Caulobacter henricii]
MSTGEILKTRLSEYSALWLASFVLVLAGAGFVSLALGRDLVEVADKVLPVSFALLGVAVVIGVGVTVVSRASLIAKCLVTLLALLLVLPLLWSPVLAVLILATIGRVTIEYSEAYAQFRIIVSQLIYPVVSMVVEGPLVAAVWNAFQIIASIVGFVASALQVWRVVKSWMAGQGTEA